MLTSSIFSLCILLLFVGPSLQTTRRRGSGRGRRLSEYERVFPIPNLNSVATPASAPLQGQAPARRRSDRDALFLKSLRQPLHDIITQHIFTWLGHYGIHTDQIRAQDNPADCEALLKHICDPISLYPHVRPPTAEEVKCFLFQKMNKDPTFIQKFDLTRSKRLRESRDQTVHRIGSHPTWPDQTSVERLMSRLRTRGMTLSDLQNCNRPLLMAQIVLPAVLSKRRKFTRDSKLEARRVLTNVALKPRMFVEETLNQLPDLGLVCLYASKKAKGTEQQTGDEGASSSSLQELYNYDYVPTYPSDLVPDTFHFPRDEHAGMFQDSYSNLSDPFNIDWHFECAENVYPETTPPTHDEQDRQDHEPYRDLTTWMSQEGMPLSPSSQPLSSHRFDEVSGSGSTSHQDCSVDPIRGADVREELQQEHQQHIPCGVHQANPAPTQIQHGKASSSAMST